MSSRRLQNPPLTLEDALIDLYLTVKIRKLDEVRLYLICIYYTE